MHVLYSDCLKETVHIRKIRIFISFEIGFWLKLIRMQNEYLLKKEFYFSFKSFANSHYGFASTAGGGLLRKPMNQPLNGVAEISQAHARNL